MDKLTANFKASELACKCGKCGSTGREMDAGFMVKLQTLRDLYERPIHISSGYRCSAHNLAVGGAANSYHLKGRAVDILIPKGESRYDLCKYLFQLQYFRGIGFYDGWVHIDDRNAQYRRIW